MQTTEFYEGIGPSYLLVVEKREIFVSGVSKGRGPLTQPAKEWNLRVIRQCHPFRPPLINKNEKSIIKKGNKNGQLKFIIPISRLKHIAPAKVYYSHLTPQA